MKVIFNEDHGSYKKGDVMEPFGHNARIDESVEALKLLANGVTSEYHEPVKNPVRTAVDSTQKRKAVQR